MDVCNAIRMPIHFFVSENEVHLFPPREEIMLSAQVFQTISWDNNAVEATFGDSPGRIYWKDVAKVMGVTDQKPHDRFTLKTRLPFTDFLSTCSAFNLSPFTFLIDPNRNTSKRTSRRSRSTAPLTPLGSSFSSSPSSSLSTVPGASAAGTPSADATALLRDMASMREQLAAMEQRCNRLEERCSKVEEQYKTLLAAHDTLARRVSVSIDTINNSYLSIAAESQPDYGE